MVLVLVDVEVLVDVSGHSGLQTPNSVTTNVVTGYVLEHTVVDVCGSRNSLIGKPVQQSLQLTPSC